MKQAGWSYGGNDTGWVLLRRTVDISIRSKENSIYNSLKGIAIEGINMIDFSLIAYEGIKLFDKVKLAWEGNKNASPHTEI